MNIIELQNEGKSEDGQLLQKALEKVMLGSGAKRHESVIQKQGSKVLQWAGSLKLLKCDVWIGVLWSFQIYPRSISIRIRQMHQGDQLNASFRQVVESHYEEICQFMHLINNLQIGQSQGNFYIQNSTKSVVFRLWELKSIFFNCPIRLNRYLQFKIRQMENIYSQKIEKFILYYRMPAFNLTELEKTANNQYAKKEQKLREKINILKEIFQIDRFVRPKRTCISLKFAHNKIVSNIFTSLTGKKDPIKRFQKIDQYKIQSVKQEFLKFKQNLSSQSQNNKETEAIVTPMKIQRVLKEEKMPCGGYGELVFGIYEIMFLLTIMKSINQQLTEMVEEYKKQNCSLGKESKDSSVCKITANLVRKCKISQQICPSLQNQIAFLANFRNYKCEHIASYFGQAVTQKPFHDGNIFIKFYPHNLAQAKLKFRQKVQIMGGVARGLNFLTQIQVIHRDLKPHNIMISKRGHSKLIDFGSCAPIYQGTKFIVPDTKLRSTQGYYLSYNEMSKTYKQITDKFTREQFERHKLFDLYSFGQILEGEFELSSLTSQKDFLRYNLKYLSLKCKELNPDDRLSHEEVIFFLKCLAEYMDCRTKFWEKPSKEQITEETVSQQNINESRQSFVSLVDKLNLQSNSRSSQHFSFIEQ